MYDPLQGMEVDAFCFILRH